MKKIFITYGTTEGQTAKIAEFISDVLRVVDFVRKNQKNPCPPSERVLVG